MKLEPLLVSLSAARALDENFQLRTLEVLLRVGLRRHATVKDLMNDTGMDQPAVNRACLRLSSKASSNSQVGKPLGLIELQADPAEPRRNLMTLSAAGHLLLEQMTK